MGVQDVERSYRSATELVEAMAGGEVSAVELAEEAIARIERHDPTLNAVCVPDFERALDSVPGASAEKRCVSGGDRSEAQLTARPGALRRISRLRG